MELNSNAVDPIIELAKVTDSLNCLSMSDITEIKNLKNPPQLVILVLEAIGVLLGFFHNYHKL